MRYFRDIRQNRLLMPTQLVPIMRQFDDMDEAITWFDSLIITDLGGHELPGVSISFKFHDDENCRVIESQAKTLREALAECPGSQFDIYVHGIDSFGYLMPVNCAAKFSSFYKATGIKLDEHSRVEFVG